MSPLLGSISGVSAKAFGMLASAIKPIQDLFTRTTSGSLGTATSGQNWVATRGTWSANGTQATSADAASNNSIASIPFKTDAVVTASVSGGTGPVFWLTDANSWWAATSYNTSTTTTTYYSCNPYSCAPCSTPSSGTYPNCNCGTTQTRTYFCPSGFGNLALCDGNNLCRRDNCNGSVITSSQYTSTYSCDACAEVCSTCYQSCPSTTTTYAFYLRLLKSVSGTVSSATSEVSLGSDAAAIHVATVGDTITAKAYSNTNMTTQIGTTLTFTPTTPTKGSSVGIIKTTSAYAQGSTVDSFTAD
jgi:hypothetical protein